MNNPLKAILGLFVSVSSLLAVAEVSSMAASQNVEVPLEHVFIASRGFDDNDNVQAVAEGSLPNACYTLTNTQFAVDAETKEVSIVQMAILSDAGICADMGSLPPELAQPIPFWREVNMGMLSSGTYTLSYETVKGNKLREFLVEPAPTTSVDSLRYAIVTEIYVPATVLAETGEIELRVAGYLSSSCAVLGEETNIEKVDDIYVFLPSVALTQEICMPANKPFFKTIKVPTPEAGRYLFHVRSQAGQSLNKPFLVK